MGRLREGLTAWDARMAYAEVHTFTVMLLTTALREYMLVMACSARFWLSSPLDISPLNYVYRDGFHYVEGGQWPACFADRDSINNLGISMSTGRLCPSDVEKLGRPSAEPCGGSIKDLLFCPNVCVSKTGAMHLYIIPYGRSAEDPGIHLHEIRLHS